LLPQGISAMEMGLEVLGLELQGPIESGHGLIDAAEIRESNTEIVLRLEMIGLELERPLKTGDGLGRPARQTVGFAPIGMRGGIVRHERDRLVDPLQCEVIAPRLEREDAEHVPRFGVTRIGAEDLPIERFGLGETSRAMMANGHFKGL
jgi:hypothetical protein